MKTPEGEKLPGRSGNSNPDARETEDGDGNQPSAAEKAKLVLNLGRNLACEERTGEEWSQKPFGHFSARPPGCAEEGHPLCGPGTVFLH